MTFEISELTAKQIQAAALAQGISPQALVEQAIDAFLAPQLQYNEKGFVIPGFVGSVKSQDPNWIDQHEELLWNEQGNHR